MDSLVASLQHGHAVEPMACAHCRVQHLCESGCADASYTCHACGKAWNLETPVMANPLAVFKPKLRGINLEIESCAPGRQAGGPAVLAPLGIEPEWLA